jgi:hypothetical protein
MGRGVVDACAAACSLHAWGRRTGGSAPAGNRDTSKGRERDEDRSAPHVPRRGVPPRAGVSWWWLWRPGSTYSLSLQMQRRVTKRPNQTRGASLGRPRGHHHCRGIDSGRALPTINNGPTARLLCAHTHASLLSSLTFQTSTCPSSLDIHDEAEHGGAQHGPAAAVPAAKGGDAGGRRRSKEVPLAGGPRARTPVGRVGRVHARVLAHALQGRRRRRRRGARGVDGPSVSSTVPLFLPIESVC